LTRLLRTRKLARNIELLIQEVTHNLGGLPREGQEYV